jgi:thiol:disulfide interchange protein/DsbC/DsbD-like thiol-disulfide interchange protein
LPVLVGAQSAGWPAIIAGMLKLGFVLFAALAALSAWAQTPSHTVTTPQVRAELVAHAPEGVTPGKPLWLGLKIEHQPHWHTYWKNPGDSGLPTVLDFKLPSGVQAGAIEWPTPSRLPIGPLMNYGYEGTLLLPVAVTVPAGFNAPSLDVKLRADWLVCKDVCIPEGGDFVLRVPAQAATSGHAALFAAARAALPEQVAGAKASAAVQNGQLVVSVTGLPAAWQGQTLRFFPEVAGVIQNAAAPAAEWRDGNWTAKVPLDAQRSESPTRITTVLARDGVAAGLLVQVDVTTPWPPVAAAPAPLSSLGDATVQVQSPPAAAGVGSLAIILLLALLGGALLNLMPCVFPVLSLKVLGFANHAHERGKLLMGGLAYTAGVVMSFVALAAVLLALRAGGEQLGWGFQLQSPLVVAALAALFTLIALNLAGVFEVGSVLPSSLASARAKHPAADAWLTGVLAVAVASPCTAPFMGASLGAAVSLPTWQALLVFATLGFGMALPYLAASALPGLARALPKPGVWMAHFKTAMVFPMLATVVWLTWVLGQQVGVDGAAALLLLLVVLSFAAWAWGSAALSNAARRGFGVVAALLLVATAVWAWPTINTPAQAGNAAVSTDVWQPWSNARVAQALADKRPVFVDFTAAWCVTCQVNKRTTFANAEVLTAFENKRVLLLRADWTKRDPAISAELAKLQRSGVPVYALYTPGLAGPKLLSEILTPAEVRAALAELPS